MSRRRRKGEFSKKLLIADYTVLVVLLIAKILLPEIDFDTVIIAWIAQLGIATPFYYMKAKHENRIKVPMQVVRSLPDEIREQVDITQIIISIVQSE